MPSSRRGKTRAAAQRRLDFAEVDARTSAGVVLIEDDPPQSSTLSGSRSSPRKRNTTTSFESPSPSKKPKTVTVTPEKEDLSKFIPTYLHKNVEYCREGESSLPTTTIQIYKWICDRYEIPNDFEQQRSFGPLSGTTFEQRVIGEYTLGKLNRIENAPDEETMICTACAKSGHLRDDCPSLI